MKKLLLGALLAMVATPSFAITLTVDSGWVDDQISGADIASDGSPITFDLLGPATFRLTDAYIVGDVYKIYLGSIDPLNLLATSTFTTDGALVDPFAGVAWTDTSYSRLSYTFGPGSYSLIVTGDGVGGLPAGLGVRLDTAVPEPATWAMMLLGFGAIGYSLRFRRRKAALQTA